LLPLLNLGLTGDIEILFVFFEANTNLNFECVQNKARVGQKTFKQPGFYALPKPESEGGPIKAFSAKFEAEGYDSIYLVENIGGTLNNIEKVVFLTLGFMVLVHLVTHVFEKKYSWLEKVKEVMLFSYPMRFLAMHALRLLTFSMVNIMPS
jgi:hypothetical protein